MVTQLEGEHRLIGTVMVANRVGDRFSFDDKDRRLFETLASQASFSLENGRLEQTLAGMRREHAELEHKALHDSLTKLANRVLYIDRVRHALSKRDEPGKDVAVMYVDLDDFKTVNDSLGHAAGDALLVQVADRMTVSVRPDDTVARLGGDEFAVLMTDVANEAEATNVAKRILDSLNTPFELQGREVWAHATIGIALAAPGELEVADLLRRADQAMYTAKGEGKGRYAVFGDRMRVGFLEPRSKRRA
jgi:diguanylate cyclase (GGDEF)-like protein